MKLSKEIGSERWKEQVRAAFDECKTGKQSTKLYLRLFNFYEQKFERPKFTDSNWGEWKNLVHALQDEHRQWWDRWYAKHPTAKTDQIADLA
jgi:hypothetical protein